ncbi:MAG: cell division protein FtsA, partial [Gemmatimonadota bacterium]|nr:cell division protein FtsA [Gemmatimonadota bacterium]
GAILSGGGAQVPGAVELAREVFALPVRIGNPERNLSGLVDSVHTPRFVVPVGLVMYGANELVKKSLENDRGVGRMLVSVKRWLQDFF